jgi:SAM-dependent methyltransferase
MLNTGKITKPFRLLGLMHFLDRLKFQYQRLKNGKKNRAFRSSHQTIVLPPDYMLFEAFQLDYEKYFVGGKATAQWVINHFSTYGMLENAHILDWGCGPGRVIRHLPQLLGKEARVFGTDYNDETIKWCGEHIPGISFSKNEVNPPLVYADNSFDFIYGLSIFTHLSELNHYSWYEELMRVSKPGAILLLTTHGEKFKGILTADEQKMFDAGNLVTRGNVVEGHRVYAAFHPPEWMHKLFSAHSIVLKHIPGKVVNWGIEQDVWVIQKR